MSPLDWLRVLICLTLVGAEKGTVFFQIENPKIEAPGTATTSFNIEFSNKNATKKPN
jgi:hypothetical protein